MVNPRILILSDPDEQGAFTYRLSVTLPSGRVAQRVGQFQGPFPEGTPGQIKQALKQALEIEWQAFKDALKDIRIQGKRQDENGVWDL